MRFSRIFFASFALLPLIGSEALAQGDLSPPPGGPQPSMKTLQQVEPRTDLFNAPENLVATDNPDFYYEIKAPGSYDFSRNTSAGGFAIGSTAKPRAILISADNVTLDLNGFQISAAPSNLPGAVAPKTAIKIDATHAAVRNGTIAGFPEGVVGSNRSFGPDDVTATNLSLSGCRRPIHLGENAIVLNCRVVDSGDGTTDDHAIGVSGGVVKNCTVENHTTTFFIGAGISNPRGTVVDSTVYNVIHIEEGDGLGVVTGISAKSVANCTAVTGQGQSLGFRAETITNCKAESFSTGFGADQLAGCRATSCETGFSLNPSSNAQNCSASGSTTGFVLRDRARVEGCSTSGGRVGFTIAADQTGVVLENCSASSVTLGSGFGFVVAGDRNRLINCHATRCNFNFLVSGDNNHLDGCVAIATAISGGAGFTTSGNNNTVVRCSAKNCGVNFNLNASTKAGPIENDPLNATNPFSNFDN